MLKRHCPDIFVILLQPSYKTEGYFSKIADWHHKVMNFGFHWKQMDLSSWRHPRSGFIRDRHLFNALRG